MVDLFANSGDPDQMLHFAASDLGLHCLPIILLGISRLQWVNRWLVLQKKIPLPSIILYGLWRYIPKVEYLGIMTYVGLTSNEVKKNLLHIACTISQKLTKFCVLVLLIHNISLTLVLLNPDIPCLCKQCRSRSVGFWRSQLIWICTVCH